jgi:Na+/H+ antiporter NhaD/arsenite permease-like protein
VVLTEFILQVARQNNLPPEPFLLALASSANIGSDATPIGNPQNLVIAVQSAIPFGRFVLGILPAALAGSVVNAAVLLCLYWNQLDGGGKPSSSSSRPCTEEEDVTSHRFSPATMSHLLKGSSCCPPGLGSGEPDNNGEKTSSKQNDNADGNGEKTCSKQTQQAAGTTRRDEEKETEEEPWKLTLWKACLFVITAGMLAALLLGLNMSWSAITAALALIVLDFKDARPCLDKVSYPLLLFFCGMFITVDGFNKTGVPSAFWEFMEPHWNGHPRARHSAPLQPGVQCSNRSIVRVLDHYSLPIASCFN